MAIFAHKLLTREEVLDNELRKAIMEHLSENPGSYLGKISRELNVPTSTLKYHLNILRSFDMVTTVKKGRCRHYFPRRRRFSDIEKRMFAALEHGPTRRVVDGVDFDEDPAPEAAQPADGSEGGAVDTAPPAHLPSAIGGAAATGW